jgi:hypothetical protein
MNHVTVVARALPRRQPRPEKITPQTIDAADFSLLPIARYFRLLD